MAAPAVHHFGDCIAEGPGDVVNESDDYLVTTCLACLARMGYDDLGAWVRMGGAVDVPRLLAMLAEECEAAQNALGREAEGEFNEAITSAHLLAEGLRDIIGAW